jgi:DNA-binding response OmpR family regulator
MSSVLPGQRVKRVLIVDDERDVRGLLQAIFEGGGYWADLAMDGETALRAIKRRRPDLITLDLAMPGLSPFEVLAQIGMMVSPPPIVAISGQYASPKILSMLRPHIWAYLSKPFPPDFLLKTCATILAVAERKPIPVPVERRRERRRALLLGVTLISAEGKAVATGQLLDLSGYGAQVDLGVPLALNSRVRLSLALADGGPPLVLDTVIRWCEGTIVGVNFMDLSLESAARLGSAVA